MPAAQQFVGKYRLFHLIRGGRYYEIWAVRPPAENTVYAMKWLPKGPHYVREHINGLKHEYQVGSIARSSGDHQDLRVRQYIQRRLHAVGAIQGAKPQAANYLGRHTKNLITARGRSSPIAPLDWLICTSEGWVHRDIKPDNFLLRDDNEVQLIDFNLARKPAGGLSKLFGGKMGVAGTHSYMSPEQIRGQAQDFRADIYSFGCMLHEFFTGKPPFTANSPNELLQRHLSSKPQPLTVFDKNITPEFAAYVQRMMAKEPKDRPANMKDVMMEIKTQKIFYNTPQPPADAEDAAKAASEKD